MANKTNINTKFIEEFVASEVKKAINTDKRDVGFLKCINPDCSSNERYRISDIGFDTINIPELADISVGDMEQEEIEEIFKCPDCDRFMSVVLPLDAFPKIFDKALEYKKIGEENKKEEEDKDDFLF